MREFLVTSVTGGGALGAPSLPLLYLAKIWQDMGWISERFQKASIRSAWRSAGWRDPGSK